jgi:tyrosinase
MSSTEYHYPVVGRKGAGTGIIDRLSIEKLQTEQPRQFALFILAFLAIQQRPLPSSNIFGVSLPEVVVPAASFMEIAAIHGKPYHEWPGDHNKDTSTDYNATDKKDTNPVPSRFGGMSVISTTVSRLTIYFERLLQVSL